VVTATEKALRGEITDHEKQARIKGLVKELP